MPESQQMSKKLSIAIPTYNRLVYLKECINSILNQTFQDFSIFVFDNASDEPVEEELKKFNDERIHFIGSDKNMPQVENFKRVKNYPFQSEYLVVFHDDDAMHPKMLELQISFLDKNKDMVFVVSKFNRIYGKYISKFQDFPEDKIKYIIYKNNYEFTKATMLWLEYAFNSAMYRTKFYDVIDFSTFSDFASLVSVIEVSQNGPCALIDAPLVNYRIHSGQDWRVLKGNHEEGAINTISFFRENFPVVLTKKDEKFFRKYSLNFLIRSCADINKGFLDFLRFMKRCRQKNLIKYSHFRYIDMRGIVSMISIIFKRKRIFDAARSFRNFFIKSQ